jgi:hypothetical protein
MKKIFVIIGVILILSSVVYAVNTGLVDNEKKDLKNYLEIKYQNDFKDYKINNVDLSSKLVVYEIQLQNKKTKEIKTVTWITKK